MNELYSIKSETLTGICDVLRSELGETKAEIISIPVATYADANGSSNRTIITIPGATTMFIDITYQNVGFMQPGYYQIAAGAWEFSIPMPEDAIKLQSSTQVSDFLSFENTDTITIYNYKSWSTLDSNSATAMVYGIDANGNYVDFEGSSLVEKSREVANTYQSDEIAGAIEDLIESLSNPPEEAKTLTGDCQYRFVSGGWDWFVERYGDQITTSDITNCQKMFYKSNLEEIPFEINCKKGSEITLESIFEECKNLKALPKINNAKPGNFKSFLYNCQNIKEIPEDIDSWFDWSSIGARNYMLYDASSLRTIPMDFLDHGQANASYISSIYYYGFKCRSLDEIVDLPYPHINATWTSNAFNNAFTYCSRLKNLIFKMPDGAPYVVKWKSQTIALDTNTGFINIANGAVDWYNSGITADKEVKDAATYEALKNDPDWWTRNLAYSRYNHDSAVATINSLPDTSAYLAEKGGTNTIKFKGASGSATDGGAINTLTDAEIAVAAAKGWTVTLV